MKTEGMDKILSGAMRGDKKSFVKLCENQRQFILYHCIKQMGNQHDGEDAAQEVFIQMQKSISSLKIPEAYIVWVRKIISNTCNKMRRGKKNAISLLSIGSNHTITPYGGSATAPSLPTHDDFRFVRWDKDFSNVQSNLTVTAVCDPIENTPIDPNDPPAPPPDDNTPDNPSGGDNRTIEERLEAQEGKSIFESLRDGDVPLGNFTIKNAWSLLNLILALVTLSCPRFLYQSQC